MSVTIDKIGNVFMRREGRNPGLPPIVSGSHIDTQPTGGKFDGNYGVLAALEVVRTLNDLQIDTDAPIEVVFWTNEEGSRFVPVMMGSGVFAGVFPLEETRAVTDKEGVSVGEALAQIGYIGEQTPGTIPSAPILRRTLSRGRFSKMKRKPSVSCRACWGSAGTTAWSPARPRTPDPRRCACVRMPCRWRPALCRKWWPLPGAAKRDAAPSAACRCGPTAATWCREVTFSIDMRNLSDALVDEMDRQLRAFIAEVERESGLQVALKQVSHYPAAPFDAECQQAIADAAQRWAIRRGRSSPAPGMTQCI